MLTYSSKYFSTLVLLLALIGFSGIVATAAAFSNQQTTDICCGETSQQKVPANPNECADIECRCFSCAVPTLLMYRLHLLGFEIPLSLWRPDPLISSDHINDIEYPPEFC